MRIYLSSSWQRRSEMQAHEKRLQALGHESTSRWLSPKHEGKPMHQCAFIDFYDVDRCDAIINFTEDGEVARPYTSGGRHVEFGMAIALNKLQIMVGPRENIFHHLKSVNVFPSLDAVIESGILEQEF